MYFTSQVVNNQIANDFYHFSSRRLKAFTYEYVYSNDITILILLTFIIILQVYYTQLNRNDSILMLITHLQLCKYSLFYTEKNNLLSY